MECTVNDYELHVQDSDEIGPGSDLVISMFAMAMLVLALVGSGFGSESASSLQPQKAKTNQLEQLRTQNLELQAEKLKLESELEALKAKQVPDDVLITLRDSAGTNYFSQNSNQISSDGQQLLIHGLRQQAGNVGAKQFNTLIIEGYASPEPRRHPSTDVDTNEQLAFDRANAVARVLVLAGIPRRCLGLMSYGRNRSEILYGTNGFSPDGSEKHTNEFDSVYRSKKIVLTEEKLATERRIEIRAISDSKYTLCTPLELEQQLNAARLP
jgi:outer membrane protein OmpA-like peptidoglycan-associated protein